jgi:two-component system phosphate regulon sensor histidine kinase PhoR
MSNISIWKVVISAAMALICICIVQGYWLTNSFNQSEKAFEEKVHITLRNVARQISELKKVQLSSYDLIDQISQDYYIVNIRDAIDATNLEFYLLQEFEAIGLRTDFEYGIYDCDTDQMVYGNYISSREEPAIARSSHSLEVPERSDFVYYFGVRFPDRKGYILKNQWIPILFTVILCLAVLFFAYATFEILRQKKLSDLQKDFINNMTHEFKTPVTNIGITGEIIKKKVSREAGVDVYLDILLKENEKLRQKIDQVLLGASVDHFVNPSLERVDVHKLISECADAFALKVRERHGKIQLSFNARSSFILGDRDLLTQAINNVIDNAEKYSPGPPHIVVKTRDHRNGLEIDIVDNGMGIPEKMREKVFDKFFRVQTGNVHNVKGFGLGLNFVKNVVRSHEGRIRLLSELNKGTEVRIVFPVA